jgi:hypothetical protein
MVLLGDDTQVDARFGLFGECLFDAIYVNILLQMYH